MGKTVNELHVMLKLHEQTLPPKEVASALHAIRAGRIHKNQKKKSYKAAKGNQGKGKAKMGYAPVQAPPFAPKPKNLPTPKKEYPAKDAICHQCGEVGHWRRNYPIYLSELMKKKKISQGASTSGIFTIELSFPNTSWIYDTVYGTHICITTHGLKGSRKLKSGALSLYVGDGHRAAVEAIVDYHLAKLNLDSALLWHCCLGHINKKRIEKLQHDGLLDSTDIKSFEKCVACMSGKMARKSYSHQVKRAKDLFGLIHTDVCGPFKIMSRQGECEFFENEVIFHKASGSLEDLEIIQEEDTHPSLDTSLYQEEHDQEIDESQSDINPIRRSTRTRRPTDRLCLHVDAKEHELGYLDEPANYKAALLDPESNKWINAMNVEMQSMKDNETGYVFVLTGGAVDWKSTKQSIFATSSTDAEYIAAFDASKEAVWIRKFIYGLGVVPIIKEPINMYCDNTGAIAIAKYHEVTKDAIHFCSKVHYLRETIEMGDVRIEKVDTDDNLADPFTKALVFPKHS
nr:zinc finger, CCHC-type [Tanacetum cinerariifolium]